MSDDKHDDRSPRSQPIMAWRRASWVAAPSGRYQLKGRSWHRWGIGSAAIVLGAVGGVIVTRLLLPNSANQTQLATHRYGDDSNHLWNGFIGPESYEGAKEKYQQAILEQYKLYADLTDRVSARAPVVDTFFLTINTAAIALIGLLWARQAPLNVSPWLLLIPLVPLLANCNIWWNVIQGRRRILTAKTQVTVGLEERLPAQPLGAAEWNEYLKTHRRGRLPRRTTGTQWIPVAFGLMYVKGPSLPSFSDFRSAFMAWLVALAAIVSLNAFSSLKL